LAGEVALSLFRDVEGGLSSMFGVGDVELFFLALVALLLFGNKLPSIMRSAGKSVAQLKRGMDEMREQVRKSVEEADKK